MTHGMNLQSEDSLLSRYTKHLDHFLHVHGNTSKRMHFLAIRFRRAILTYKTNRFDGGPIEPPPNCIFVLCGSSPPIQSNHRGSCLLFSVDGHVQCIPVRNSSTECLLRALFPKKKILFSLFKSDVLFLVATENPFAAFTKTCRKDEAFKALFALSEARLNKRRLTLDTLSKLRFFKRSVDDLDQFNQWTAFAFEMAAESCMNVTRYYPSARLGKELYLLLKRSEKMLPAQLPPLPFYECELLSSDSNDVGIVFILSNFDRVDYVSPMVVVKPLECFRDSCSKICNAWLPLYRNREAWQRYGLPEYARNLYLNKRLLKRILIWLKDQTSEKHEWITMDLTHVAKILFGTESKHFLKSRSKNSKEVTCKIKVED